MVGIDISFKIGSNPTNAGSVGYVVLFHARTDVVDEQLVTAGGRVFSVAATGATLEWAIEKPYKGAKSIKFANMFHRKDIG